MFYSLNNANNEYSPDQDYNTTGLEEMGMQKNEVWWEHPAEGHQIIAFYCGDKPDNGWLWKTRNSIWSALI